VLSLVLIIALERGVTMVTREEFKENLIALLDIINNR
jgi:hypothetical protein